MFQADFLVKTVGGLADSKLGCDIIALLNLTLLELPDDPAH
jgi:hypothetical protein